MHSVLLAGPAGSDPAGKRAVYEAVRAALPGRQIDDVTRSGRGAKLLGAARRSGGLVVAGASLNPSSPPGRAPRRPTAAGRSAGADSPRAVATMAALARAARRPLAVVGLSTGQLEGPLTRTLFGRAVRRPDLLLLGDEESAGYLAAAGAPVPLRVAADPAWAVLAPPAAFNGRPGSGEAVVVVVDGRLDPATEAGLAVGLEGLANAGHPIRLMPWAPSGTGDGAMSWRLARRLRSLTPVPVEVETVPTSLQEAAERMASAHLVVALRYRSLLAAAAAGVPAAGVAVEARIGALAARLGQIVVQPADLGAALPTLAGRAAPPAGAGVVAEEMARARAGLDLMRLVLEPSEVGADELNCLPLVPVPWLS